MSTSRIVLAGAVAAVALVAFEWRRSRGARTPASAPGLSELEIRAAGATIQVPFMAPTPLKPGEGLRYSDGRTFDEVFRERFPGFYEKNGSDASGDQQDESP